MNFLLAIILVFYAVLAVPIPSLNLNLVRTNAQKIAHYDKLILQLRENFIGSTRQTKNKLLGRIIEKTAKVNKLRPPNLHAVIDLEQPEFYRLMEEAIQLVANLPVEHRAQSKYMIDMVRKLFFLGSRRLEAARSQFAKIKYTVKFLEEYK
jgi:hypothetical protein